jgi:hypothetical protein
MCSSRKTACLTPGNFWTFNWIMYQITPIELPTQCGKLPANVDHMTIEELTVWKRAMQNDAEAYLFSIGQPLSL